MNVLFIVSLSVLVLEEMQQTISERLYRGMFGLSEILGGTTTLSHGGRG